MSSVANDDDFAIHILCDGIPDIEGIGKDPVFGCLSVGGSDKNR
jgi:hypothetical protein